MILQAAVLITAGLIGAALGVWTIDRDSPTVIERVNVLTPQVTPGGKLRVEYHVRRLRDCATHVDRVLFDSARVRGDLMDVDSLKPLGPMGEDTYVVEVPIPTTFSSGPALYRILVSYRCNLVHRWFWPIVTPAQDIMFNVSSPYDLPKEYN
jgi:hypothetical protein